MRILVTGAYGWTAKSIVEALIEAKHDVIALDLPGTQSHADTQLFEMIYHGSVSDYDVFHIIGAEAATMRFDIERTERVFGFVPALRFEDFQ